MKNKINWRLYSAALSVNLISLVAGGAYSWTSPVLPKLNGNKASSDNPFGTPITPFEESWIASLISLGAAIGPFLATAIVDRIGRKKTLQLLVSIPMIISHLVLAFAKEISLYYFSRFFMGLGIGCVYAIVPVYIGEIAEDSNRGALGCWLNIFCTLGSVFSFSVGPYVSIKTFCLLYLISPISFLFCFGFFIPESPYYWLMVDKEEEAKDALRKLRGEFVQKELEEIKRNVEESKRLKIQFSDLAKSKVIIKGLFITSSLMFFQQFSGIGAIISYMQPIFEASGSSFSPEISAIIIGVIQTSTNLVTSQLVDRLGRRILLIVSLTGLGLSLTLLGFYFYLKAHNFEELVTLLYWLPVCSLVLFIVMFNIGIGPLPWAIIGELFPPHFRAIASTVTTFVCLFLCFALTVFFPNLIQIIGMASSFWIFAGFCFAGVVFVWMVVPETKGKSLADIQVALDKKNCENSI